MATAVVPFEFDPAGRTMLHTPSGPVRVLPIPWSDARAAKPEDLRQFVAMFQRACEERPENADFWTCLGMAHAMNHDYLRSMDALMEARQIDPRSFLAQLKLAELHYRLRELERAEEETLKAVDLAANAWELSLVSRQLTEIRRQKQEA